MSKNGRKQLSLGQLLAVIAATALIVRVLSNPAGSSSASIVGGFLGMGFLIVALMVAVVDHGFGLRCPQCGGWTMARVAVGSFRDRFYRCSTCHSRCRRGLFRGWDDASDPQFDVIYTRKRPENPWTALPGVEDEDLIYSKTHVNLLINKQRRNPNAPDQSAGLISEPHRDSEL